MNSSITGVVLPIRSFRMAKKRLVPHLAPRQREQLALSMADIVAKACAGLTTVVVHDDLDVGVWAVDHGFSSLHAPGVGLNGAAQLGAGLLRDRCSMIAVVHADLPFADSVERLVTDGAITLVADRHGTGTNAVIFPSATPFDFSFGPGSFAKHVAAGEQTGLVVLTPDDEQFQFDIDTLDDLAAAHEWVSANLPWAVPTGFSR